MISDRLVISYQLIKGLSQRPGRHLVQTARSCSTIAHIRIFIDFTTIINIIDRVIGCKVQPFNRSQSEISMSSLINTHQFTLIELCFSYRITSIIRQASSFIIINIFTRISSCLTISIQISTGFQIMFMNGIYRSHGTNKTCKVTIWTRISRIWSWIIGYRTSYSQIQTSLEPFSRIHIIIQTTRITFKVSLDHITIII